MPFTAGQLQAVTAHLQGKNNACPICGANNWAIFDDLIAATCVDVEYKRPIQGKLLPMVALICNECGNVRQITAKSVGLLN